jgi:hypothetical protein
MVWNKLFRDVLWRPRRARYVRPDWVMSILGAATCVLIMSSCSASSTPTVRVIPNGEVMLVPQVSAGLAGWCMAVVYENSNSCGDNRGLGSILAESWSSGQGVTRGAALVTKEVEEVSVDGSRPVPTREASAVAGALGLRSVIVEITGKNDSKDNSEYLHFTPLNASGSVIRRPTALGVSLGVNVPVVRWQQPHHAPLGVCDLETSWSGVSTRWGEVVIGVKRSYRNLMGRPFLSCASNEYFHEELPLKAGILLDALHPGAEPAALPAMKTVAGHLGIFEAQGAAGEGQLLGRRVAHGWLVVEEVGSTLDQRINLLEHLYAKINL